MEFNPQTLDTAREEGRIEGRRRVREESDRLDHPSEVLENNADLHAGERCPWTDVRTDPE